MALETGNYISDLVAANPAAADDMVDGDNHLRLLKSTIKATFPNITGIVSPTQVELNYVVGVTSAIQTQINTNTAAIAGKAGLASPAFTGTPTAPTAAVDTNTTQLATTAYVIGQTYAKLASPTFTGTPAAPTATALTNTTQLATTAFVTTADALKADIASPTFTGVPAAPTATIGTNTTQLATTAFVKANSGITIGTELVTTSGATRDFTGLPTTLKRITIMFSGVSSTGVSPLIIQLADTATFRTAGYTGFSISNGGGGSSSAAGLTIIGTPVAAQNYTGNITLSLEDPVTNNWTMTGALGNDINTLIYTSIGKKALAAVLSGVRLTTVGGTDTFDLGAINVMYE